MHSYRTIIIVICFIAISQWGFGQDRKFGKITKAELEEKFYPKDSSANAAYLYKYRNTYIEGDNLVTEIHNIIKFYNKTDLDLATKMIKLYKSGSSNERVSGLKAYTYNLANGKIVEEKLDKDAIYKSEYHKMQDRFTFTMPNVKEGSVIEYEYKIYSPFFANIEEYKFQHSVPVKQVYAKLYTPQFFKFNKKMKGYLPVYPKISNKTDHRLGAKVNITEYTLTDVPALKDEPFVDNIDNYRAGVEYELVAVHLGTHVKSYSQTWKDVAKTLNESDIFKKDINKSNYFDDDLDQIIGTVSGKKERLNLIYNHLKSRVKWNEIDGLYPFNGLSKAYKEGVGNVGVINLMLVSMLRYAGLKADPVILSTRDNGIPIFPTINGLNYIICAAEIDGKQILLDATDKYGSPGVLPSRVMNWHGKLIKPDNSYDMIGLTPKEKALKNTMIMATLTDDGSLTGKLKTHYTDNQALSFREKYALQSENDYLTELESENGNIEISDFEITGLDDLDQPVSETYAFGKEEALETIGGKYYLSPMLFLTTKSNPFKLDKREFPIDFAYPYEYKNRVILKLPATIAVESIPEAAIIKLPDDLGEFSFMCKNTGNAIQVVTDFSINYAIIPPNYYPFIKQFFNQIVLKEAEKIVLKKA